ncbi:MAG: response regulator [Lewinellaceae bacterium]|nr:response regulator [Lewinellaceae bacterium]
MTVLLSEDEPIIACDIQLTLESSGLKVVLAAAPQEIEALCQQYHPGLVILNFDQDHWIDGLSHARRLSSKFVTQILIVTGSRKKELAASGANAIGYEILHKPFTHKQLLSGIERLTQGRA